MKYGRKIIMNMFQFLPWPFSATMTGPQEWACKVQHTATVHQWSRAQQRWLPRRPCTQKYVLGLWSKRLLFFQTWFSKQVECKSEMTRKIISLNKDLRHGVTCHGVKVISHFKYAYRTRKPYPTNAVILNTVIQSNSDKRNSLGGEKRVSFIHSFFYPSSTVVILRKILQVEKYITIIKAKTRDKILVQTSEGTVFLTIDCLRKKMTATWKAVGLKGGFSANVCFLKISNFIERFFGIQRILEKDQTFIQLVHLTQSIRFLLSFIWKKLSKATSRKTILRVVYKGRITATLKRMYFSKEDVKNIGTNRS